MHVFSELLSNLPSFPLPLFGPVPSLPLQLHLIPGPDITVSLWTPSSPSTQEQKFCRVPLPAELPLLNPKESAWADGK